MGPEEFCGASDTATRRVLGKRKRPERSGIDRNRRLSYGQHLRILFVRLLSLPIVHQQLNWGSDNLLIRTIENGFPHYMQGVPCPE